MAYPPDTPPSTRNEDTLQAGTHAPDHNALAAAIRDIIAELGANPSGAYASLDDRLVAVAASGEGAQQAETLDADVAALLGDTPDPGGAPSATRLALEGAKPDVRVDLFTASGTWTKPAGARMVTVQLIGGGAGGGGGEGPTTYPKGGDGGGGGGFKTHTWRADDLPATVSVTVGAGGAGQANTANGGLNAGAPGGNSEFNGIIGYGGNVTAYHPLTATTVAMASADQGAGASKSPGSTNTPNFNRGNDGIYSAGGGGGGGWRGANNSGTGGIGKGGAGNGGDGRDRLNLTAATAGTIPGGGGGGGYQGTDTAQGGAGGNGARGEVRVITYY